MGYCSGNNGAYVPQYKGIIQDDRVTREQTTVSVEDRHMGVGVEPIKNAGQASSTRDVLSWATEPGSYWAQVSKDVPDVCTGLGQEEEESSEATESEAMNTAVENTAVPLFLQ